MNKMLEHDQEFEPGIPQALPADEEVLWKGQATFKGLLRHTFHARKLFVYFSVLIGFQQAMKIRSGASFVEALPSGLVFVGLALTTLGILAAYARLCSNATMFTITTRRIVMRAGIAVPVTLNLPFTRIDSVDLRRYADGSGDIAVLPERGSRVSYILLWPLVKPWRLFRVRPVLRAIDDVDFVAETLTDALAADAVAAAERQRRAAEEEREARPTATSPQPTGRRWKPYPTIPLAAAVSLVAIALIGVAGNQFAGDSVADDAQTRAVTDQIELYFEDRPDGSVIVIDAENGKAIETLEPGTNGFLRSTMRTFVRERRAIDVGDEMPFALQRIQNGQLILKDTATGREVDLWAFGQVNARAFSRFLVRDAARGTEDSFSIDKSGAIPDATSAALTTQEARQ